MCMRNNLKVVPISFYFSLNSKGGNNDNLAKKKAWNGTRIVTIIRGTNKLLSAVVYT